MTEKEWAAAARSKENKRLGRSKPQLRIIARSVRAQAKNVLNRAVLAGKIVRQPCFMCGAEPTHAHHASYAKEMYLCVTWLCAKHHKQVHAQDYS